MQGVHLRKYGVQTTLNFELYETDGVDFKTDAAHAAGDTKIMKDDGAEANTTNGFTDEGQGYSIVLTATEMEAERIVVYIADQGTKAWLDKCFVVETYGNASAMHGFDLDTVTQSVDVVAMSGGDEGVVDNIIDDYDGTGYNKSNSTIGTCTVNTDFVGVEDKIDVIDANIDDVVTYVTNIDGNIDQSLSDTEGNIMGLSSKSNTDLYNDIVTVDTVVDAIKAVTDNLPDSGALSTIDTVVDAIKAVTDNLPNSGALTDIDTGVNNIEAKLPTNYIMGSSDQTDKDDDIDAILVDTNEIQGKLPTNYIMGSSDQTDKDDDIDAILVDTNEIQGKLPTNYIMGSSDQTDKDDEIDSIKSTVEGLNDLSSGDIDSAITANTSVVAILADTNEIQGKLPTNYIMGSSVVTDKDDEIDAIKTVTDNLPNSGALTDIDTGVNNIEAKLPTNYIMGSSDQADNDGNISDILTDTNDIQTRLPDNYIMGSSTAADMNDEIDNIKYVTDNLPNDGALNDLSAAEVNAEVVDVLTVDTDAELGSMPAANAPIADKVNFLFMHVRNKITQTTTTKKMHNDAGAEFASASVSDDGTTLTVGEFS